MTRWRVLVLGLLVLIGLTPEWGCGSSDCCGAGTSAGASATPRPAPVSGNFRHKAKVALGVNTKQGFEPVGEKGSRVSSSRLNSLLARALPKEEIRAHSTGPHLRQYISTSSHLTVALGGDAPPYLAYTPSHSRPPDILLPSGVTSAGFRISNRAYGLTLGDITDDLPPDFVHGAHNTVRYVWTLPPLTDIDEKVAIGWGGADAHASGFFPPRLDIGNERRQIIEIEHEILPGTGINRLTVNGEE